MTAASLPQRPRSLRATSSAIAFWACVGLAAFMLGDAAVRGRWDVVVVALPGALLVLWALWLVLWRSCIRVSATRLEIVNLARVHDIPWARVADVRERLQVLVAIDDGREITCWGGPFSKRARGVTSPGEVAGMLMSLRSGAPDSDEPVRARWDVPTLAVGGLLVVVLVVQIVTALI